MSGHAEILLIANNFPPVRGGSAAVYSNVALAARGRVAVLAPRINYVQGLPLIGWREHDRHAPYTVTRLALLRTTIGQAGGHWSRIRLLTADVKIRALVVFQLIRALAGRRIRAVCIGELLASNWIIQLLRYVPRLRVVVYVHGEEITTDDHYDPTARRRRGALLAADRIIVVSRFTRQAVLALIGTQYAGRVVMIENGVDTHKFSPGPPSADLRSCYMLGGEFVFITVCRLLEKKGVDHTLRAFAGVVAAHPACRLLIVGTGPYEQSLRALSDELGLSDSVIFAGAVADDELVHHYRLADVFVMPNRALENGDTEGFGVVFLEANACGLPVIGGLDGGTGDAVRDGWNGVLVDGRSVSAIEDAMMRLHDDAGLRVRLAEGGRQAAAAADWGHKGAGFVAACLEA
jgi:phosphatidylinositol alpha-1,6-mannosyltransferase